MPRPFVPVRLLGGDQSGQIVNVVESAVDAGVLRITNRRWGADIYRKRMEFFRCTCGEHDTHERISWVWEGSE